MRQLIEALDLALEALEFIPESGSMLGAHAEGKRVKAITAIKQARSAPVQDSTCNETLRAQGKAYPRTCRKCGLGPCIGAPKQPPAQPAPVQQEREILRAAQSEAVMPLIGPMLDAWEGGSDFLNEYPELDKQLRRIHRAMENATPPAQPAPVQEPVAWRWKNNGEDKWLNEYTYLDRGGPDCPEECEPLYTTPPAAQRQWVGLTDEELREFDVDPVEAKLMIAKLKEKNT